MTKDSRISLRISSEQLAEIDAAASAAGLSRSDYIALCCKAKSVNQVVIDTQDIRDVYHQYAGVCGNLNQMMRIANTHGKSGIEDELSQAAKDAKIAADSARDEIKNLLAILKEIRAVDKNDDR